jgi:hypothetical protein
MTRSRALGIVLLAVGLLAAYAWLHRSGSPDLVAGPPPAVTESAPAEGDGPASPAAAPATQGAPEAAAAGAPVEAPSAPSEARARADRGTQGGAGLGSLPTVRQVQEEAARDPHAPSRAIVRFSVELQDKIEAALETEAKSNEFFPELDHCATGESSGEAPAESARLLCLSGAGQLAEKYPALRARYENLESRMPDRLVRLRKLLDRQ